MRKQFIVNRSGVFFATPEQGTEFQCVKNKHNKYYYWSQIVFEGPELDSRGFLVDHGDLDAFIIEQTKGSIPSCELLIQKIGLAVGSWLAQQNMPAYSIYIKIASTFVGSEGFIEGTIYPSETDNEFWRDQPAIKKFLSRTLDAVDLVGSCPIGKYRFKTVAELHLDPDFYVYKTAYHGVSWYKMKGQLGYLTDDELNILDDINGAPVVDYKNSESEDDRYIRIKAFNGTKSRAIVAIPIWATTCKPLN